MSGGGQGSSGQGASSLGAFGVGAAGGANPAPTQSYGGQGLGGFGGFQTPYSPSTGAQGAGYIRPTQQSYGPFGFSGQDVANYYQGNNPWAQNQAMSRYGISPFDVGNNVQLMGVNAATGKPYSQDDIYNNTLNGYYAPPTNTKEGLNTPYYGTFNNFSAQNLRDYVNKAQELPTQANAPSITDLSSATGKSGNAEWDKLVNNYISANPKANLTKGWNTDVASKQAYQNLLDQYNRQNSLKSDTAKAANAQNIASAMQQYGVSAHDLAQSGALSQADYTRMFRPSNQYQGVTNPNQYYQPIYQTQYQNYASPAFAYQGAQNNMMQSYQSPLRGGYGGYGAPSYGGQGINSLLSYFI